MTIDEEIKLVRMNVNRIKAQLHLSQSTFLNKKNPPSSFVKRTEDLKSELKTLSELLNKKKLIKKLNEIE